MNVYAEFLLKQDSVLLLVDIQKSMLDLCSDKDLLVKNVSALIDIARLHEIPILLSVHNSGKLGGFLPELLDRIPQPCIYEKLEFSCFENETLFRALQESGRRTLLLAGLETHVCIFHTGAHALRLGYRVHVAADAVASRSKINWEVGLRRVERAGAVISSTEMIIFELLNRAGTSEFRAALPLIKTL
jgi:nicotinamidase-related amidase